MTFTLVLNSHRRQIPAPLEMLLKGAIGPKEINDIIARNEAQLAKWATGDPSEEYLSCDQTVDLMEQVLRWHKIPYKGRVGYTTGGDSHVWLTVGGRIYDPTKQGCRLTNKAGGRSTGEEYLSPGAYEEEDWRKAGKIMYAGVGKRVCARCGHKETYHKHIPYKPGDRPSAPPGACWCEVPKTISSTKTTYKKCPCPGFVIREEDKTVKLNGYA